MSYIKITDEAKKATCRCMSPNEKGLSDLSFYIKISLSGCTSEAVKFTGKKLTRKTWTAASKENKQWLVQELIFVSGMYSGLSQKNRRLLYIACRDANVKAWLAKFKLIKAPVHQKTLERIEKVIKRVGRLGFKSFLGDEKDLLLSLRDEMCNLRLGLDRSFFMKKADRDTANYLYRLVSRISSWSIDGDVFDVMPLLDDKLILKLSRKAMKNVGLRPDATTIYLVPAERING